MDWAVDQHPEAQVRLILDRLLKDAGWLKSEIAEEQNLLSGRLDYRLADLCILEAKKPTRADRPQALKLHLAQSQRYGTSLSRIPFLMVSDGELHYIQDRRSGRIERLFAMPTRQQLEGLAADEGLLIDGYVVMPSKLFEFQREAIQSAIRHVVDGRDRLLLEMATGSGKTLVAAEIISSYARIIRERHDRHISVLFLVDRDALEVQSAERLGAHLRELKVNTVDAVGVARVDVLVAQVATMQHRYKRDPFHGSYFDLIVVDEAHRSVHGDAWRQVIEGFACPQIGLTATPPRLTDDATIAYFGDPIFLYSYEQGVRDGLLAPSVIHRVKTTVDRDGIAAGGKLFTSEDFGVRLMVDNRDKAIVGYYNEHFYGRKALVFAASSLHAESLWEKFNEEFAARGDGYECQFVLSSIESPAARRDVVERFQRSDSHLRVLINLNILTAGFDYPELDLLFMCRYTRHKSLYLQMKGRGSRLPLDDGGHLRVNPDGSPLKDRFWMVDFVGVTEWETRDFEPDITPDDATERVVNEDPEPPEAIPSVDVEVGIAEVTVIDPFETRENPMVRALRTQLDVAKAELEDARHAAQIAEEKAREAECLAKEAMRRGFIQTVRGLHAVAPMTPMTEDVLRQVAPTACDLAFLNAAFDVELDSVEAHIHAVMSETT